MYIPYTDTFSNFGCMFITVSHARFLIGYFQITTTVELDSLVDSLGTAGSYAYLPKSIAVS